MNPLEQAIVKTLAWFDIFSYPLTDWEVYKYLWAPSESHITYEKVRKQLAKPSDWLTTRIENQDAWYFLRGKSLMVEQRQQRHAKFRKRWQRSKKMAQCLTLIPFLESFALCNLFPLESSKQTSDIDTFIITKDGRIWTVRLLLTTLTWLLRKWRHGKKIANRFCLSFYISRQELDLRKIAQRPYDIYLVYWLALLAPLSGNKMAKDFFKINGWLKDYLPNWYPRAESPKYSAQPAHIKYIFRKIVELILSGPLGKTFEAVVKFFQVKYMKRQHRQVESRFPSSIVVSDAMLKFHNQDTREHHRILWENKVNALLS